MRIWEIVGRKGPAEALEPEPAAPPPPVAEDPAFSDAPAAGAVKLTPEELKLQKRGEAVELYLKDKTKEDEIEKVRPTGRAAPRCSRRR